jgi:ATP/maltotriose-dependent transcriptional regulator MalT
MTTVSPVVPNVTEPIARPDLVPELSAALFRPDGAAAAIVVRGEAGIGKTTLLTQAAAMASAAGHHVLKARPAFGERDLPYAGLGDLLAAVPPEAIAALSEPQRRAIDVALLRVSPGEDSSDWRPAAQGLLEILRGLAGMAPLTVLIDDEPWLDRSTSRALSFALRRLVDRPVTLIAARRDLSAIVTRIDHDLPERTLEVGPMSADDLGRLIRTRLGVALPLPSLARVHGATGGNPFYALQIADAWLRAGGPQADEPMPMPERMRDIVAERLAGLTDAALEVLLVASATARPTLQLVEQAVGGASRVASAVEESEAAGVIQLRGQEIWFTHPLLASGTYAAASVPRRRQLHRRLAQIVTDPEHVARHLAAGTIRPAAGVAALIERGAQHAAARGAPDLAATLYEDAARLTSADEAGEAGRRILAAVSAHAASGDTGRARVLLERRIAKLPGGEERAEALSRLAVLLTKSHGVELAVDAWNRALVDAPAGSVLAGDVHDNLAWYVCWLGDSTAAHAHALEARRIAEAAADEPLMVRAMTKVAMLEFQLGRGINLPLLEHAAEVERATAGTTFEAEGVLIQHLYWSDELDEAHRRAMAVLESARTAGDVGAEIDGLYFLTVVDYFRGEWDTAMRNGEVLAEKALHAGADFFAAVIGSWRARILGSRGDLDTARQLTRDALAMAQREKHRWMELNCLATLGIIELTAGNPAAARDHGLAAAEVAAAIDVPEPGIFHTVPDAIEALIVTGELRAAEERLSELQQQADATGRRWALAAAARCRGMLAAANGDTETAVAEQDRSVEGFRALGYPFELGRSLLAAGAAHRRVRDKKRARELLNEASGIFERLRAPQWGERAAAELARIDGRAPASGSGLTPTERQVAELVAAGLSNREVADRMSVTVRTVESNLTRIYQKLDVRSRSQLVRVLAP